MPCGPAASPRRGDASKPIWSPRFAIRAAVLAAVLAILICQAPGARSQTSDRTVFDLYPDDATAGRLADRLLSPLVARLAKQGLAQSGKRADAPTLRLTDERFLLAIPDRPPPVGGYGVLVFIPPWPDAQLPTGWRKTLSEAGIIFVSADRSGNDESILERRDALAIVAVANVRARYRIDPSRVYVGGFSGGSRVAMRIALAFPDVFTGLLLNAGSDPIGAPDAPLPAPDLFRLFQRRTRIAFVTGSADEANVEKDGASSASLHAHCVVNVSTVNIPQGGHEAASAAFLRSAIRFLDGPATAKPLPRCEKELEAAVLSKITMLGDLVRSGDSRGAARAAEAMDRRYGGLVASATLSVPAGPTEFLPVSGTAMPSKTANTSGH